MNKILGYILAVLGLVALALTVPSISNAFKIALSASLITTLTIAGLALLVIGIIIVSKSSTPKVKEVPIYHGKDVVGFRVIKQK